MKINFEIPDKNYHQYCLSCEKEAITRVYKDDLTFYKCSECHAILERSLVIDPQVNWWIDEEKTYWHESVGCFIINTENKILFFQRTIFPFALSIPAGHVDTGEEALVSIKREIIEETGLTDVVVKLFSEEDVHGDKCRRGCDDHKWHLFIGKTSTTDIIKIEDEGKDPCWLTISEALSQDLTMAARYFLEKYGDKLIA